jgi:large subunit ribosomal protein L21
MKYAVIKLGGKQFMVQEGDVFELERQVQPLNIEVLMYSDDTTVLVGKPVVEGVSVVASVVEEKRGDKVRVARFKRKVRYDKENGHRQPLSVVKIEEIAMEGSKKPAKEEKEVKAEKKAVKPRVAKSAVKKVKEVKEKKEK